MSLRSNGWAVLFGLCCGIMICGLWIRSLFGQSQGAATLYLYNGYQLDTPFSQSEADWLDVRRRDQLETLDQFKVFHNFQFEDRLAESRISFRHIAVEDAGRRYKAIHYDHGNGLAAADVDGDGFHDLYFTTQVGSNELWRNLGNGKFEDITASSGVGLRDRISVAASFADIDNDGDQDLYVTTVRGGNALFENVGEGKFRDVTATSGLQYKGHSSGAVFFDYDRDGLIDLFLTNIGRYTTEKTGPGEYFVGMGDGFTGHLHPEFSERSILYRNLGGNRFGDVTQDIGLGDLGWNGDAATADLNRDGFTDLYVLNMQGNDHYLENVDGKRFLDKTERHFPKTPWGSMGVKFFDFNNDGMLDLFLTDMHSDMSEDIDYADFHKEGRKSVMKWGKELVTGHEKSIWGNAFYKNLGEAGFDEVSDSVGLENYWPWGVSVDDINADGFADVFITASMNYMFRYGINSLKLNNRGLGFLDSEFLLQVEPRAGRQTITRWFDVDCSGQDSGYWDCQDRSGRFQVMGALGSRSSVVLDLDNDGDLDIVTNEFNSAPQVLISNLTERRPVTFLKILLRGTASNRVGLGAKVTLKLGGREITRVQDGKSGYLSQSVLPLYFGLDGQEKIDSVEVLWPSGVTQLVDRPAAVNTTLEIVEEGADNRE